MILPYEAFLKDSNFSIVRAEEILTSGWSINGCSAIFLDKVAWEIYNNANSTVNRAVHSFRIIETLLRAYSTVKDIRFLRPAVSVVLDWCQHAEDFTSPILWDGMVAALRAHRMAFILEAGEAESLLNAENIEILWQQLLRHKHFLDDDANIDFHNNHGYFQIACQIAMGRRLQGRSQEMFIAMKHGKVRMHTLIQQQFTNEFIHKENSPGYFKLVYETLKIIVESGLMPELDSYLLSMEDALSCFVMPDQHLAMLGDTDFVSLAATITTAKKRWKSEKMWYVVSGGKFGRAPNDGLKVFPESGYGLVRVPSVKMKDYSQSSYLLLNAAFHSRTHKHADDFSILWADRGINILVDSGRYGYVGKTMQDDQLWNDGFWYSDPRRVYCESTPAHNTLQIDSRNTERRGIRPYGSALTNWGETESGVYWLEARCKCFKSIHHTRVLFFMPAKWLIVFDWFYDNNKQEHSVRQWFHFASDIDLIYMDSGYVAFIPQSTVPLKIAPLLGNMTTSPCILGQGEAEQGWYSPSELQFMPNYAMSINTFGAFGSLATVFTFSNTLITDADFSKINVSGNNGQLRWVDDNGRHTLRFQRHENKITVEHLEQKYL